MNTDPYNDKETIKELLKQYENLRRGRAGNFLEEEAFEKVVDHYHDLDEFAKAMEAVEMGIQYFPFASALQIRKADIFIAQRKYEEALAVLDGAELLDATDINLYILKTDVFLALDQQEKAVSILEYAVKQFEGEEKVELLFALADVYDDYEEFEKVFDCLLHILREDSTNEEALYKICFWTDFTGRNEESIRLHLSIIEEHPFSELAWFNLGTAYQGLKLYEKAIDAYQYALAIDEKFDYAYRNMGDAYMRLRQYKEAIEMLQKVLELSQPEEVIYEAIGHCYDRLKNYAQARFHYRKASHLNAENSKTFYRIALTYFYEGQWASAAKQLETALKLNRQQADYNLLMGECKLELGQLKEAIHYFSTVVRLKPKNKSGWEALIRCLYGAGYYAEALEQVRAALEHTGGKPLFIYYLSAVLLALGKSKEALLQLERGMELSPRLLNKFVALNPAVLQNSSIVEVIARNKRSRKK